MGRESKRIRASRFFSGFLSANSFYCPPTTQSISSISSMKFVVCIWSMHCAQSVSVIHGCAPYFRSTGGVLSVWILGATASSHLTSHATLFPLPVTHSYCNTSVPLHHTITSLITQTPSVSQCQIAPYERSMVLIRTNSFHLPLLRGSRLDKDPT